MIIDVDPSGAVPVDQQVRTQLAEMIVTGALPQGFRLPTIRQLAAHLALAPVIARVYRELEAEGLVVSRVRHGTVVAAVPERHLSDPTTAVAAAACTGRRASRRPQPRRRRRGPEGAAGQLSGAPAVTQPVSAVRGPSAARRAGRALRETPRAPRASSRRKGSCLRWVGEKSRRT